MQRIRMGKLSEVSPGQSLEKKILAKRIAIFNENGKLYGIESDCKHMRASLGTSGVTNGVLTCRWHGWKYDLKSGECLTTKGVKLKRFDVEVEGDDIYIVLP